MLNLLPGIALATIAFLTPLFTSLPNAALGALIIMAIVGLIDMADMRYIAEVEKTDLVGLSVASAATLVLGIEPGILIAVAASLLVVFARMSMPHSAALGRVDGTASHRNVALHLAEVEGRVRDVPCSAGLWDQIGDRILTSTDDAVTAMAAGDPEPLDQRHHGGDERTAEQTGASAHV